MAKENNKSNFFNRSTKKNSVYIENTVKIGYESCVYVLKYNAVGVMVSPKCENIESRQFHLHSTCVLNGTERCGVIQAPNFRDGGFA